MELTVDERGPELRVTLPGPAPSLTDETIALLRQALVQAENSPSVRLVVLLGGPEAFCTGLDFTEATTHTGEDATARSAANFFDLLRHLTETPRMVVSVVAGRASGGGVGLAAASDLVVATPRAEFVLPEALWGLMPCCVLPFVQRRCGFQTGYAMALSTLPVGAEQALRMRLADEISADPDTALRKLAVRVGRISPETIGGLKGYARDLHPITPAVQDRAVGRLAGLMALPDVQRRLGAFATHGRIHT